MENNHWKKIYNLSNPDEKKDILYDLLWSVELHKKKMVLSRGRLVHEKRGYFRGAHFLNDRRRLRRSPQRMISLASFAFILIVVSVATWLFTIHAPAKLAATALSIHLLLLWLILYIKPYSIKFQTT